MRFAAPGSPPDSRVRLAIIAAAVLAALLVITTTALAATGSLSNKKTNAERCVSDDGGSCLQGVGLEGAHSVAVSADGKNVYVASYGSGAVAIFDRDAETGVLAQKEGTEACVSNSGTGGSCVDGVGLGGPRSVAVSADGKSVYVVSGNSDSIAIFDRDTESGVLNQKEGTAGCTSENGTGGNCVDGVGLDGVRSVTVSPDGKSVYTASTAGDSVAIFDRDTETGVLTQKEGTAGCISETGTGGSCVDGVALDGARWVTVSPDGENAYVASFDSDAVAVFDRDTATGALAQKEGTLACISEFGSGGSCVDGVALDGAHGVTISPDGASAYVASFDSDAVAVFERNTETGALSQMVGTDRCVSDGGDEGLCGKGVALDGAHGVTVSPDGASVYVASYESYAVAIFDRNIETGALAQKPSRSSCVSEDEGPSCVNGQALVGARSVAISPDGKNAYVASEISNAVAVLDRQAAPKVTIGSGPSGPTNETSPSFGFSSDTGGSTFECSLDGAEFTACSSPQGYSDLAEGAHELRIRATDAAENLGAPTSRLFTVDTIAPTASITSGPEGPTNERSESFTFTANEVGSTFECSLDGAGFAACTSPRAHSNLAEGDHEFQVRATDPAGNLGVAASSQFTVDVTPPTNAITSGPEGLINESSVSFSFTANEPGSTFECRLDSTPVVSCSSPRAYSNLAEGDHLFWVRATDPAGNRATAGTAASREFTVDTVAPTTSITSGPEGPTDESSVSFAFEADEAGVAFECSLDGAGFAPCSSPQSYLGFADGEHELQVRATDPASNPGAATSREFSVDTVSPTVTISSGPQGPINQASAEFAFDADEAGSTLECSLDGAEFAPCESPQSYSGLAEGDHEFRVRATDLAGNVGAASREFSVDAIAPAASITSGPAGLINRASADFTFTAGEVGGGFECSLDGDPFTACGSPQSYPSLAQGTHEFRVRATDAAANVGPATSREFSVDTIAPTASITFGPLGLTSGADHTFTFAADEDAVFACSLDGAPFSACSSPLAYSGLAVGDHEFRVRATDLAGNVGAVAGRRFTVWADSLPSDTAVYGRVGARRIQRQRSAKVWVKVRVWAGESVEVRVWGKVKMGARGYPLSSRGTILAPGAGRTFALRPKKAGVRRKIVAALERGGTPRAKLTVRLTDAAGNSATEKLSVKLKR